jgi:hypothetical protein
LNGVENVVGTERGHTRLFRCGQPHIPGVVLAACALLSVKAPVYQGAHMRTAFISIERTFVTYLEVMTLASQDAELGDRGACRRR